jgi:hypothetical protein
MRKLKSKGSFCHLSKSLVAVALGLPDKSDVRLCIGCSLLFFSKRGVSEGRGELAVEPFSAEVYYIISGCGRGIFCKSRCFSLLEPQIRLKLPNPGLVF